MGESLDSPILDSPNAGDAALFPFYLISRPMIAYRLLLKQLALGRIAIDACTEFWKTLRPAGEDFLMGRAMKLECTFVLILSVALLASESQAQESGLFGGRGIGVPSSLDETKVAPAKTRWPKMLDFSQDESAPASRKPFSELFTKKKPSFDLFKPKPNDKPGFFKKPKPISEWFPKKDPSKPNVFQQMNSKSKDFFDRTTNWASQKNQNVKDKSSATWDSIVKDFKEIEAKETTTPAQPNMRTAGANGQPKVRF